jgi:putative phosphoesterase
MIIGVLSDAHGNTEAFRLAISHLRKLGASRFIFLGDAVGYIPSNGVLTELIRIKEEVICIQGNHEIMLTNTSWNPEQDKIYNFRNTLKFLSDVETDYIKSWPIMHKESYGIDSALFIHGGLCDFTNEYVYPNSDLSKYEVTETFVFMGHTHYPFVRKTGNTTFVNVGSCGLPRDIGNLGSFATFNPEMGEVILYRFDISSAIQNIRESNMKIHESVLGLFKRQHSLFEGQLIKE